MLTSPANGRQVFKEKLLGLREGKVTANLLVCLADVDKATKKYDDDTKHGQTEGVSLARSIPYHLL